MVGRASGDSERGSGLGEEEEVQYRNEDSDHDETWPKTATRTIFLI